MGQLTQTTAQVQVILDDADAANVGKTSLTDSTDTTAVAVRKSGFYSLGASSSNAPSTDRAILISAVRDTTATGEIRYGQVAITESNGMWWNRDDGGVLGTWYEAVSTAGTQTLTNKTLTSPVLTTPQINDTSADHQYVFAVSELAADRTVTLPLLTGNDTFVFEAHTQTLTNKTLTSPVFNTGVSGTAVLDDDTFATASSTTLATSESIKAYVDATVTGEDLDFAGDTGTGAVDLDSQTFTIAGTANEIETAASSQTLTIGLPDSVTITTALSVDTINEKTAAAGVTVDSLLIKDGGITAAGTSTFAGHTISDLGTVTTADIDGGSIDGTTIGAASAAAGTFTTGQFDTSLNVDGTVTADGLTVDSGSTNTQLTLARSTTHSGISFSTQISDFGGGGADLIFDGSGNSTGFGFRPTNSSGTLQTGLVISPDGNVGINTASPDRAIKIEKDNAYVWIADAAGGNVGFIGGSGSNDGLMRLYEGTGHTAKVEIHSNADSYFNGGSVGIGTDSPVAVLDVVGGSGDDSFINSSSDTVVSINDIVGGLNAYSRDVSVFSSGGVGGVYIKAETAFNTSNTPTYMAFHTHPESNNDGSIFGNATERMRIDSSGNLLVGKTDTTGNVAGVDLRATGLIVGTVSGGTVGYFNRTTSDGTILDFRKDNVAVGSIGTASSRIYIGTDDTGLRFTNDEITPFNPSVSADRNGTVDLGGSSTRFKDLYLSGDVFVNKTTKTATGTGIVLDGNGFAYFVRDGAVQLLLGNDDTGGTSQESIRFVRNTSDVGSIDTTNTATSYNTSSDYRLKENVVAMSGATERLKQLKPSRFNFIADPDKTVDGFLAHEVQDIVPEAITGTKDAVDAEGNPEYQGIDQSKLVPLLVATIQELEARIAALEGAN
jgi:hypothetical protein